MVILFSFIQKTRRETANKPCSCGRNSQGLKLLKVIGVEIHNVFPEKKKKKRFLDYFKIVIVVVFVYVYFFLHCAACITLQTPEFLSVPPFCVS